MRARYYSPELRRFVNADILAGRIDNAVTLNRYAYANANPVSFVDPRGLSADERRGNDTSFNSIWSDEDIQIISSRYNIGPDHSIETALAQDYGRRILNNKDAILDALR